MKPKGYGDALTFVNLGLVELGLGLDFCVLLVKVDFLRGRGKSLPNLNEAHKNGIVFRRDVSDSLETHTTRMSL